MKYRTALSLSVLAGAGALYFRLPAEAKPDAVSAASLTVAASNITSTSALIKYSADKYDYGTRTLCYDPSPATPKNNCTTKTASGNQGSFTITGLKAATKYNYSIQAIDTKGGERPYTSSGSFTTLTATGIAGRTPPAPGLSGIPGLSVDAVGRSLPESHAAPGFKASLPGR